VYWVLATVVGVQYGLLVVVLFIRLPADNGHAQGVGD
jgi:hypothetical protein